MAARCWAKVTFQSIQSQWRDIKQNHLEFKVFLEPHLCGYRKVSLFSNGDCPWHINCPQNQLLCILNSTMNKKAQHDYPLQGIKKKKSIQRFIQSFVYLQKYLYINLCSALHLENQQYRGKSPKWSPTWMYLYHFEYQEKKSHCFQMLHVEFINQLHVLSLCFLLNTNKRAKYILSSFL